MRRRGRDRYRPAQARSLVEVQCFKLTPTNVEDRPGFAALLATSDSGGLWTANGASWLLVDAGP